VAALFVETLSGFEVVSGKDGRGGIQSGDELIKITG
jgi:hypothetical protein